MNTALLFQFISFLFRFRYLLTSSQATVERLRGRLEAINFEAELQNEVILLEGVFHTSVHALSDCAIGDHEIIFTERL